MALLAEAYIHLKPYKLNDTEIEKLLDNIINFAGISASEIYEKQVSIELRAEEGSLKLWLTVGGVLLGAYGAIANYKGFKESIAEICKDAKDFGYNVCNYAVEASNAGKSQVYRTERRLKDPGKVKRFIDRIEKLEKFKAANSDADLRNELYEIRKIVESFRANISEQERLG
jgi:hypothetical protein